MNINALSSLQPNYLQPGKNGTGAGNSSRVTFSPPQDAPSQISLAARFLSKLQRLQEQDPAQFQEVTSQIADQLHKAAAKAQTDGNSTVATRLNQLGDQFQNAATGGQLPTLQDLQQAGLSGHHHPHGGHPGEHASPLTTILTFLTFAS